MTERSEPAPRESAIARSSREPSVRGATDEELDRPAGLYLASIRWDGRLDPEALSASAFLSRL